MRSIFRLRAERTEVMEVKSIAFLGEHNERGGGEGEMRGVQRDTDENPPLRAGTDMIMGKPLVVVHHSPPPPGCCTSLSCSCCCRCWPGCTQTAVNSRTPHWRIIQSQTCHNISPEWTQNGDVAVVITFLCQTWASSGHASKRHKQGHTVKAGKPSNCLWPQLS